MITNIIIIHSYKLWNVFVFVIMIYFKHQYHPVFIYILYIIFVFIIHVLILLNITLLLFWRQELLYSILIHLWNVFVLVFIIIRWHDM